MLPKTFKLGRKPAKFDLRIPMLSKYTSNLPPQPDSYTWDKGISQWGMMANDRLGDCTAAALAHQVSVWTVNASEEVTLTDAQVIKFYSDTCGYVPGDPQTDVGGVESDILKQWYATPGLLGGYNLLGFAAIRPQSTTSNSIRDAIYIFGGAYLGINLPETIKNQGYLWQVHAQGPVGPGAPGSLGGHAVIAVAYDTRVIEIISWGTRYWITWDFYRTYCEEAYALISEAWIDRTSSKSPLGNNLAELKDDMNALRAA